MFAIIKNIFILAAILLTGALGYYLYVHQAGLEDQANSDVAQDVSLRTAEFLRKLNELKAIELDSTIFSDPRFSSLTNFATPLQSEPYGTPNPFDLN